jgi:hypothetical protein
MPTGPTKRAQVETENEKDPKGLLPYQENDTEAEDSEEMGICNPIGLTGHVCQQAQRKGHKSKFSVAQKIDSGFVVTKVVCFIF